MAQEKTFIAVRWAELSRPGIDRYVIKNRETDEVVDDNNGKGYQSPKAAHASFSFKQKYRGWRSTGTPDGKHGNVVGSTASGRRVPIPYGTADGKPNRPVRRKSNNQQTNVSRNAQSKKVINQRGLFD